MSPQATKTSPWREPMVWMIVAAPVASIVMGIATVVLAMRFPDPPLSTLPEAGAPAEQALPAMQGRNHAATGAPGATR
ncbi:hypothetical protein ACG02S_07455 [Roseateles sp. DC23W]|uniref:Nitrogen fixation protein FixH n=1 Tax=Pelomonas dachongensis TaxID=3299029 RepID=A0ABW7EM15_9BURK